jgi:hypothetical protein
MATIAKEQLLRYRGQDLYDRDGDKLGGIDEIYLDAETNEPEWASVTTGFFGSKQTFVPLRGAFERDGSLAVQFAKETVEEAPRIEPNGQLSQQEARDLYEHYGLGESGSR